LTENGYNVGYLQGRIEGWLPAHKSEFQSGGKPAALWLVKHKEKVIHELDDDADDDDEIGYRRVLIEYDQEFEDLEEYEVRDGLKRFKDWERNPHLPW
jgi:hypothetical protein